jgi:hypothetical protein
VPPCLNAVFGGRVSVDQGRSDGRKGPRDSHGPRRLVLVVAVIAYAVACASRG